MKSYICYSDRDAKEEALEHLEIARIYFDSMKSNMETTIGVTRQIANNQNNYVVNLGLTPEKESNDKIKSLLSTIANAAKV